MRKDQIESEKQATWEKEPLKVLHRPLRPCWNNPSHWNRTSSYAMQFKQIVRKSRDRFMALIRTNRKRLSTWTKIFNLPIVAFFPLGNVGLPTTIIGDSWFRWWHLGSPDRSFRCWWCFFGRARWLDFDSAVPIRMSVWDRASTSNASQHDSSRLCSLSREQRYRRYMSEYAADMCSWKNERRKGGTFCKVESRYSCLF